MKVNSFGIQKCCFQNFEKFSNILLKDTLKKLLRHLRRKMTEERDFLANSKSRLQTYELQT